METEKFATVKYDHDIEIEKLNKELLMKSKRIEYLNDAVAKEEGKVEILKEIIEDLVRKLIDQKE